MTIVISQAAGKLYTNPPRIAVTTASVDRLAIDMTNSIRPGEVMDSVAASLVRVDPEPETAVADFVTATEIDSPDILIDFDGGVLVQQQVYRLEVLVTMNTGTVVPRLTYFECET